MRKYTQEEAKKKFKELGFKLLDKYVSNNHKQKVKHLKCGNILYCMLTSCKCHYCMPSNNDKKKIAKKRFKEKCEKAGFIFVSYKNAFNKKYKCPICGNVYTSTNKNNLNCYNCYANKRREKSYNKLKKFCKENGDKLLTKKEKFRSITQKVKIEYKCGHVGKPKGNNYLNNPSCNSCARKKVGKTKRIPLRIIKRNCKLSNVKITSKFKKYGINGLGYYDGICLGCGGYVKIHSATYKLPRCPKCNPAPIQPIIETKLREWLCRKTKEEWIKVRPKWLPSPSCKGYNLELDMYCKKLHKAVEYQGPHHYLDNVGIFGLNKKAILKIISHDKVKKENMF